MSAATEIDRMHAIVGPIASDLGLDVYDIERRGATVRVTLDTEPGSDGGISLDSISLATRLISRELDHEDPIAGHYTLEITSPGLERPLRTAAHFQREVGKTITARLRDPLADPRRVQGTLIAADERIATLVLDDGTERAIDVNDIDKARTVVDWSPPPKPGKGSAGKKQASKAPTDATSDASQTADQTVNQPVKQTSSQNSTKEKHPS